MRAHTHTHTHTHTESYLNSIGMDPISLVAKEKHNQNLDSVISVTLEQFWMWAFMCTSFVCVCVCLFYSPTTACGSSQARGQIRAVAASLYHNHSNTRYKLAYSSWQHQILNPLREAGAQTLILRILVRFLTH